MIELAPRSASPIARFGGQPIAIAAVALVIVVLGIGSIALWRAYTGNAPETDRVVATRQLQARAAQASEQLVEKTKGLEATQQESIDQLQVVQDQLQTVRRLLAAQQTDTKKLSEQVGTLTEAIEGCGNPLPARKPPNRTARLPPAGRPRQSPTGTGARTATAANRRASRPSLPNELRATARPAGQAGFPHDPRHSGGGPDAFQLRIGKRIACACPPPVASGFFVQRDKYASCHDFSPPSVNCFTFPHQIPGQDAPTGWREPISISGAGKVVDGIYRRRPCFFALCRL